MATSPPSITDRNTLGGCEARGVHFDGTGCPDGTSRQDGKDSHTSNDSQDHPDYRAAFTIAHLPMAMVSRSGTIVTANPALGLLLGVDPASLTGQRADLLTGLARDGRTRGAYHAVLRGNSDRMRAKQRLTHADGHTLWAEVSVQHTGRGDAPGLLTVMDISERLALTERLRHVERHDRVTRLPNRATFLARMAAALGESATGRIGLCYLDLDDFKAVNDTLGHSIGDQLLSAAAQRLAGCAAARGHTVARLGSDEFGVLVESSTGTTQLTDLAQSLLDALQAPFHLDGQWLGISASIGVVERATEGTTTTSLMQAADTTLYWAKADGKARWTLFDPERSASHLTRQSLSARLRPAVERGEFTLEYQPIVGLADEMPRGAEALVRWHHPRYGVLGPDRFVELAEENGAIVPLGRWVLAEACRQARRWQREHGGQPPFVSVNVAVRQVWDSDLVSDVASVLQETGLPAGLLQLELTESDVMGSAGRPLQALRSLADMGVRIAIDDFGTGYSNLAYLSRLPVRVLKLDGAFVRGFRTARNLNPADETIVTSLVQLAHKLGLTVTAECVEGPAQAERLRRIGCDTGQGWHYARPMPPDRIASVLTSRHCAAAQHA